jgi:hypothetical protein
MEEAAMKLPRYLSEPSRQVLLISLLLCLLGSACSSSKKTGTVVAPLAYNTDWAEMVAVIELDDGTRILAQPNVVTETATLRQSQLTKAGQRVEVAPLEAGKKGTSAKWRIVRVLEAGR